jgi:D-alanine transaminase
VDGWRGPLSEARISVQDRAFLFGDGVYEVLRSYGGHIFQLEAHLKRLESSAHGLRLPLPRSRPFLQTLLRSLLRDSGYAEARIYVQVTRGAARREHIFPDGVRATLVAWVEEARRVPEAKRRAGLRVITQADARWNRCHLKALVLLPNVLARQEAFGRGADEALLIGSGGIVREGAGSNVFIVSRRRLRTHPLTAEILPGVTRQHVLQLAQGAGYAVSEKRFRLSTLLDADEVFLSSTALEVVPVVRVDRRRIGDGKPGPITRELMTLFEKSTR